MISLSCNIGNVPVGGGTPALIAGPCVAESLELCRQVARQLKEVCGRLGMGFVFKASYDKANRSSGGSYRGPGLKVGLEWLSRIKAELNVPVLADVHEVSHVAAAAGVLDCIQIPAFLCRQTDLILEAARTGLPINVKKGQFMAPWDMKNAVDKIRSTGNAKALLTERGASFGYNRLVTDFCAIPQMRQWAPVVFDVTHSVQEPGALGNASGGQPQYAPMLAMAAMAAGADALFIETHPCPKDAKSDAATMISLDKMEPILARCLAVFKAANGG
jgi:2-dehydro-3-deoxyphosphooctonate aldolase (KDO 8-P synthase)